MHFKSENGMYISLPFKNCIYFEQSNLKKKTKIYHHQEVHNLNYIK